MTDLVVSVLLGLLQGIFEWLPVSSEGVVALATSALTDAPADAATRFGLFVHAGTAVAAAAYYRRDVAALAAAASDWRPGTAFEGGDTADLSFVLVATLATGVTGLPAYAVLDAVVSDLTGGAFLALVGGLLVLTGLLQRTAGVLGAARESSPDLLDAVLVGVLQGLAVLPGISRSGTTVSALLLRDHSGESSLRLSFLLSIPAALAANGLVLATEGVPAVDPLPAVVAVVVSAVVGYLTVGALVSLVRRVPFWLVCVGFGTLGVLGGGLAVVLA